MRRGRLHRLTWCQPPWKQLSARRTGLWKNSRPIHKRNYKNRLHLYQAPSDKIPNPTLRPHSSRYFRRAKFAPRTYVAKHRHHTKGKTAQRSTGNNTVLAAICNGQNIRLTTGLGMSEYAHNLPIYGQGGGNQTREPGSALQKRFPKNKRQ